MTSEAIYVVVVAYNPDASNLNSLCSTLVSSGACVIVVDNTEKPDQRLIIKNEKIKLIQVGYNSGIANAQNVGTTFALKNGASTVVYFDQDTVISEDYLEKILGWFDNESASAVRCPVIYDAKTQFEYPSISLDRWGLSYKVFASKSKSPVPISIGISSGTAVPAEVFKQVGLFDERLFIDHVDTDWFLKCRHHSVPVWIMPQARIYHTIGDGNKRKLLFNVHIHSARRVYYQTRNSVTLMFRPHVPIIFSVRETLVVILHKAYQTIYVERRWHHLRLLVKGVVHGIIGKLGPLED